MRHFLRSKTETDFCNKTYKKFLFSSGLADYADLYILLLFFDVQLGTRQEEWVGLTSTSSRIIWNIKKSIIIILCWYEKQQIASKVKNVEFYIFLLKSLVAFEKNWWEQSMHKQLKKSFLKRFIFTKLHYHLIQRALDWTREMNSCEKLWKMLRKIDELSSSHWQNDN